MRTDKHAGLSRRLWCVDSTIDIILLEITLQILNHIILILDIILAILDIHRWGTIS